MKRVLHIFLLTAVASALLTAPAHGAAPASASLASASGESSLTTLGALSPQSVEGGFAGALQYAIDSPGDYLFGRPTSDDTIYEWEDRNVDRGKNAALIPPGFGTPTSYLPNSGEYLTPNLVPGALSGGLGNQVDSVGKLILKNNLKKARTERKLSQNQLAEMVGVSRNTISSIETGQFNPTAKLALVLCIALDKKFEELFYF